MEHRRSLSQKFQDYGNEILLMFGFKQHSREPTAAAIYKAAKTGQTEKLEKLLLNTVDRTDRNSMVNIIDDIKGNTPLTVAVIHGHIDCVSLLIDYGADVHHMGWNPKGGTPLHEAIHSWTPNNVVRLLLCAGSNPFLENIKKKTAWDMALRRKDASLFRLFEKHGKFAQYVLIRVFSKAENKRIWVRRWMAIIPRFSFSPRLRQKTYLSSTLVVFEDASSYDPLVQFKIDDVHASLQMDQGIGTEVVLTVPPWEATNVYPYVPDDEGKLQLRVSGSDKVLQLFLRAMRDCNAETADKQAERTTRDFSGSCFLDVIDYEDDAVLAARLQAQLDQETESQTRFNQNAQSNGAGPSTSIMPKDDADSFSKETNARQEGLDLGQTSSEPLVGIKNETDNLCVVCMDAPKSAGFAHGNSCHWCVCKPCGKQLWESGNRWCPLCRKRVDNIITDFFAD